MTITIDLPSEVETKIKAQASNDGVSILGGEPFDTPPFAGV